MEIRKLIERLERVSQQVAATSLVMGVNVNPVNGEAAGPPMDIVGLIHEHHLETDGSSTVWLQLEET